MRKNILSVFLIFTTLCLQNIFAITDDVAVQENEPIRFEGSLKLTGNGIYKFVIKSNTRLNNLDIFPYTLNNQPQWHGFERVGEVDGKWVYQTTQQYYPNAKQVVKLSIWTKDGSHQIRANLSVPAQFVSGVEQIDVVASDVTVRTKAEYEASARAAQVAKMVTAPVGSGNAWLDAVNQFRVQRGLHPFRHNQALYNISVQNDNMGGVHSYTGGRSQIWAGPSDINYSISLWMGAYFRSHGVHLIGQYTEAGVYCGPRGCTITF